MNGDENSIKARDLFASKMTSMEIQQAKDLANECMKKSYKNCTR